MTQRWRFLGRAAAAMAWAGAVAALVAACTAPPTAPTAPAAPAAPTAPPAASATAASSPRGPLAATAAVLTPPAGLHVEGVPPQPQARLQAVRRYADVQGTAFVDWHPTQREMLVSRRASGASTTQLFRLRAPLAALEPLTEGADPVTRARWEPRRGRFIVFARGSGGDESFQLFRLDPETRAVTQLTAAGERHALLDWLPASSRLLVASVPLDRTAAGGRRDEVHTTLALIDPLEPSARRVVTELPGGGWFGGDVSPDEHHLVLTHYLSATESELWVVDLGSGTRRRLLPREGEPRGAHLAEGWSADGRAVHFTSDRAGEFREAMRLPLPQAADGAPGEPQRLSAHTPWDVSSADLDPQGRWLAVLANVDGRGELRLLDPHSGQERPLASRPEGGVSRVAAHKASGELALQISSPRGPSQVWALDPASGRLEAWTRTTAPAGLDLQSMPDQEIVRWRSFDGRTISGILSLPPATFSGRRPVLMVMHGGPESQARIGWNGRLNYLVRELGIAVLEPNVRGSSGYGKTFLDLDNGRRREDSVRDMASAIDWTATHPRLDAQRVVVMGGSYGGYMALAASTRLADRIAGAVSSVGISNFVSFLERTESYRRDLRRVEYGDERDPAMREFLLSISPLTNAERITKPLMVAQGRNDPRVPWTESEQIVRRLQTLERPVWYLLADNEGHGFARRENADYFFVTLTSFLTQTFGLR